MRNAVVMMIATVVLLSMSGCNKPETPAQTQEDVTQAAREGAQDVTEARADRSEVAREGAADVAAEQQDVVETASDARQDVGEEQVNVEREAAKAAYAVSIERCEAKKGDAMDACKSTAKAVLETAEARLDVRM